MRPLFILLIYYLAAGKDRHMGSYSHRGLRPNEWKLQVIIVMKVIETMHESRKSDNTRVGSTPTLPAFKKNKPL